MAAILQRLADRIAGLNEYSVEVNVDEQCPRCGAEDNSVPVFGGDGVRDYCPSCATEVTGLDA